MTQSWTQMSAVAKMRAGRGYKHNALAGLWRDIRRDKGGVAALEFALLLPLMIGLYFAGIEISNLLIVDRKVTAASNTVADLVAQDTSINNTEMNDIFLATRAILTPFPSNVLSVKLTSVVADIGNVTTVAWSDALNDTPYAVGANITLPPGLTTPGSSVIMAEVSYTHTSPIGQFLTGPINIQDQAFLRPRRVLQVLRTP